MTEKQARALARSWPLAAKAGWLLACDAPENIAKGQAQIDAMCYQDSHRAIQYRDYCVELDATARARWALLRLV